MDLTVNNINFEGRKNPRLHLKRKQIKRIKEKETELLERCKTLQADCEALELPFNKVSKLAYDNPKAPKVTQLWKLQFDMQYNYMYGSYSKYKASRIKFAKEAAQNLELLKYVNAPITVNGSISIFSKIGRNITKNRILDIFRRNTLEEKQLIEYYQSVRQTQAMHKTLGIR